MSDAPIGVFDSQVGVERGTTKFPEPVWARRSPGPKAGEASRAVSACS
jgi:hypothetical protein